MTFQIQQLFQQHEDYLFRFAMKLTNGDRVNAADLVQETAAKVWKHAARFTPETNFRAWASVILRNQFINDYRRLQYRRTVDVADPVVDHYALNHIENEAGSNLGVEEVNAAVAHLDDLYRIPFLRFVEGYQYQEIAEEMELPIGTVKSRIFYARKQLRSVLTQE